MSDKILVEINERRKFTSNNARYKLPQCKIRQNYLKQNNVIKDVKEQKSQIRQIYITHRYMLELHTYFRQRRKHHKIYKAMKTLEQLHKKLISRSHIGKRLSGMSTKRHGTQNNNIRGISKIYSTMCDVSRFITVKY